MTRRFLALSAALLAIPAFAQPPAAPQPPANPPPPAQPAAAVKSKVKVTVPQDDADLSVEAKATNTKGKVREFDTPDMEAGKRYVYDFQVTWKPNTFTTVTRKATRKFTAGDAVEVDLTKDEGNDKAVVALKPPTDDVIAEAVKAAKLTKDDVVFDLGGADARLPIAAVKGGAKRGVLVQPDATKATAAKEQVKKAELEGKVDVQPAEPAAGKDYAEAAVVFLYAGEEGNTALRPVLLRDLKPGARVISYRFKMGDWAPTATTPGVNADGDNYEIYTWTVTDADKQKYGKK
jgi:uncharacterized protein (TIGR03000 family)